MLDENGGKSTLRVHVDMYKIENITCQIVLRDGHSCFKTMRLKFEGDVLFCVVVNRRLRIQYYCGTNFLIFIQEVNNCQFDKPGRFH